MKFCSELRWARDVGCHSAVGFGCASPLRPTYGAGRVDVQAGVGRPADPSHAAAVPDPCAFAGIRTAARCHPSIATWPGRFLVKASRLAQEHGAEPPREAVRRK